MQLQFDSLKYARILAKKGIKAQTAESIVALLTELNILNLYSKHEVDSMLSEAIREVFVEQDKKLAEQRREFDVRMQSMEKYHDQQLRDNKTELLVSRRWMIGTIITIGTTLSAYLSAMLHFSH